MPNDLAPPPPGLGPVAPGTVRFVPLGGLGEVGMNCFALEHESGIVVVDCGVTFPTTDLGVDVYHPRFDYLLGRADRVLGVVITHGHEDHIGALPYLLDDLDVPVFGPAHALELVRGRLEERGDDLAEIDLVSIAPRAEFDLGPFTIEPIRVTHSITEATALAISSDAGVVVHTGDFKLDDSPPDGELTDVARLRELGEAGVDLLLSDSTNIDSPGRSGSERDVGMHLEELLDGAPGRVVLGMFASNVQRLKMVGAAAIASGRRVCLLGRSIQNHVKVAEKVGKLAWPSDLVVPPEHIQNTPREKLLVIASGTQAERTSSLTRLSQGIHPLLRLEPGDRVVLSSRIIPGNDRPVFDMMSAFLRLGVDLVTRVTDPKVHASGHAHRDEQLAMIEYTRPRGFVPVHGTLHHLTRHAALAKDAGVADIQVVENGATIEVSRGKRLARGGRVVVGRVAEAFGEPVTENVLRERAQLGQSGAIAVSIFVDERRRLVGAPEVLIRGVVEPFDAQRYRGLRLAITRAVEALERRSRVTDDDLVYAARTATRRFFEEDKCGKPVVLVTVGRK